MYKRKDLFFYIMLSWKQNTLGLNSRKVRISFRDTLFRFQDFLYYRHLNRICFLISIG